MRPPKQLTDSAYSYPSGLYRLTIGAGRPLIHPSHQVQTLDFYYRPVRRGTLCANSNAPPMIPRILLGTALIPGTDKEMQLYQSGDLFSIKIPGRGDLMNSRVHGSEKALADLACGQLGGNKSPRLLIGGLGMGFTLAAALKAIGPNAEVVVAELVPEVVTWNRTLIGAPAGDPLTDKRSHVYVGDVADVIRQEPAGFDAILMDVDNGPEALVRRENDWLYSSAGLRTTRAALRPRGVLAVWSSSPDRAFSKRLRHAGFEVREHMVRPHRAGKGPRHHIWIGT